MLSGISTTLMLLMFLGLVAWAWSGSRKSDFDAAARLPLEDDAAHAKTADAPAEDAR